MLCFIAPSLRLFLFDVDHLESPPTFAVDAFFPIRGSFDAQLQCKTRLPCVCV